VYRIVPTGNAYAFTSQYFHMLTYSHAILGENILQNIMTNLLRGQKNKHKLFKSKGNCRRSSKNMFKGGFKHSFTTFGTLCLRVYDKTIIHLSSIRAYTMYTYLLAFLKERDRNKFITSPVDTMLYMYLYVYVCVCVCSRSSLPSGIGPRSGSRLL